MKLAIHNKLATLDSLIPYASLLVGCEAESLHSSGVITLGYLRKLNNWLSLGCSLSYENATLTLRDYSTLELRKCYINSLPLMAVAKGAWLRREHLSLYSKLGFGMMPVFLYGKLSKLKMAIQLTPIGVEFGKNHVFGFFEAVLGMQGILIGGLRFPF